MTGERSSLTFKWISWKKKYSVGPLWRFQHQIHFIVLLLYVYSYEVREDREEPPSSDLLPQPPPTSWPGSKSPSGCKQFCSLDNEAQTVNSLHSAKRKGKNGLSRGDSVGQMETESASVYLSSPSDVCPPAIGCLPGWVAELSPTAHEVLNTEPE